MKRMTIRVDDYIYDGVCLIAKESKISANKVIANLVKDSLNKNNDIDYSKNLNEKIDLLIKNIDKIDKRQLSHFKVSKQHFANFGYLSNADINEDKCLNELFRNKFND